MARENSNKEIDGVKYVCLGMPATKSHAVMIELLEILGRPAFVAIATGLGDGFDSGIDKVVDVATELLMHKLTPETANRVVRMMLDGVQAEGVGGFDSDKIFDEHFRGRIMHMYKVIGWSIQVNYSDFFGVARSNHTVANAVKMGGQALTLLTATLQSGLSAAEKTESTSETS